MAETATKQVTFKFVVDQQSFAQVRNALQALTREAEKFGKAMSAGGGLFGGNVGRNTGLSVEQTRAGNAAGASRGGAKTLIDMAFQGASVAEKDLNKLANTTRQASTSMGRDLQGLASIMQKVVGLFGQMSSGPVGFVKGMGQLMGGQFAGGGAGVGVRAAAGAGGAGAGEAGAAAAGGMGFMGGVGLVAGGAAAAAAALWAGTGLWAANKRQQVANLMTQGEVGQVLAAPWARARQYGTTDIGMETLARMQLSPDAQGQMARFSLTDEGDAMSTHAQFMRENWGQALGLGWGRFTRGIGWQGQGITEEAIADKEKAWRNTTMQGILSSQEASFGFTTAEKRAGDYFNTNMEEQFTAQAFVGARSGYEEHPDKTHPWKFGNWDKLAKQQHLSMTATFSAQAGLRTAGGAEAARFGNAVALAQRSGYSGYDALAAAAGRLTQTGGSDIIHYAMGGGLGGQQRIQLGQLGLGTGFEEGGGYNPMGRIAAIQGAADWFQGQGMTSGNIVSSIQAGMQGGGTFFGQTQGIGGARGVLAAITATAGSGMDFQARNAMMQTPFATLLSIAKGQSNKVTPELEQYGVTKSMVVSYVNEKINSATYSAAPGPPGSNFERARAGFIAYQEAGGDKNAMQWARGQDAGIQKGMAAVTAQELGGYNAALGVEGVVGGGNVRARKGGGVGVSKFKDVPGTVAAEDAKRAESDAKQANEHQIAIQTGIMVASQALLAHAIADDALKNEYLKEIADHANKDIKNAQTGSVRAALVHALDNANGKTAAPGKKK